MYKLRDYQVEIANRGVKILRCKMIVYLAMQVRCGKTLTALEIAKLYGATNVLFLTKLKAIKSIQDDYNNFGYEFGLTVINNESLHKVAGNFDLIIQDEVHRFGAFPKPSQGCKLFKQRFSRLPIIMLSGTPTPESFSQIYHQFWISVHSPFGHVNFYKWAKEFVNVTQKNLGYGLVNDYSKAKKEQVMKAIEPYMINFTQKEAGFTSEVKENILMCRMNDVTYSLCSRLKKHLVIEGKEELIMADTAVKLMGKLHQLFSGTIKFHSGNAKVLDYSKGILIHDKFKGKKIGIFYKFKEELNLLKEVFGDNLTTDLEEFNTTDKNIALQIVAGREGISLKSAKYLVYFNMDYSATSYWQSRDRLTTRDRLENEVFYVFAIGGIEEQIYKSVMNKKTFTSSHFKQYTNGK